MGKQAEPILHQHARLGEGALWYAPARKLYWLDITGQCVFIYDPKTCRNRSISIGRDVGTIVPCMSGNLILAVKGGFASLNPDTEEVKDIVLIEEHLPNNRMNDGKCDPMGRFWAGSLAYDLTEGAGSLYCMDTDLTVRQVLSNVTISNGLVWSKDEKTFYYIDSATSQIAAYDYDKSTGSISNRRVVVDIPKEEGLLDGMSIDENDNLWVAVYGAGEIRCWDPANGQLLDKVKVPYAKLTTSCAFGGLELNELYITTASEGLTDKQMKNQPNAGDLFCIKLDVKGTLANEFAG